MSSYLVVLLETMVEYHMFVHSRKFDRNQSRVLFDWFDFIHRCFFHSCWSGDNQAVIHPWVYMPHPIVNYSMIIAYSALSFFYPLFGPNPLPSFFNHWYCLWSSIDTFPSHSPDWIHRHVLILCVIDYSMKNGWIMKSPN